MDSFVEIVTRFIRSEIQSRPALTHLIRSVVRMCRPSKLWMRERCAEVQWLADPRLQTRSAWDFLFDQWIFAKIQTRIAPYLIPWILRKSKGMKDFTVHQSADLRASIWPMRRAQENNTYSTSLHCVIRISWDDSGRKWINDLGEN